MKKAARRGLRGALGAWLCAAATAVAATAAPEPLQIPVEYHKLGNGLKVVLSRDTTAPVAAVAAYYNIGFRIEPK
ncbi:MAG: insulinase family protein, partial [Acidobacteriota bacterium]